MANKSYDLPGIGIVNLYKRSGSTSMRLSITSDGSVRVTIPTWTPYRLGLEFVKTKQDWIAAHRPAPKPALEQYAKIGKAHRLLFVASIVSKASSRLSGTEIKITYPSSLTPSDLAVQKVATGAAERALRAEAERLLPRRLQDIATQHGFTFSSVDIKRLRRRWGSCSSNQNITFNYFLMQLPWQLIDYVIIHELVHTRVLHHGAEFWEVFETVLPTAKELRREMRAYQPTITPLVSR